MRISDWSSDVCSSDLHPPRRAQGTDPSTSLCPAPGAHRTRGAPPGVAGRPVLGHDRGTDDPGAGASARPFQGRPARKSVVEGKSVSVRVELVGRRIIKNNKTHNHSVSVFVTNE